MMIGKTAEDRRQLMSLHRDELLSFQLNKLNQLLSEILPHNEFYRRKFGGDRVAINNLDELRAIPFTTKEDLQPKPSLGPFAANRTFAEERYVRCHRTSGTHGRPLVVLDTSDD